MNDLEELLRTDLARAAEPIESDLDADELVEAGHRVRRSRTMRVGAGITAVLVTAAGLGLVVATAVGRGSQAPVLATPSPVPSVTPSVTPSTTDSPTITTATAGKATFDLTGFGMNKADSPFDQLVVAAEPTSTGTLAIAITGSKLGHADQKATAQVEAGRTSATFVGLGKRAVVTLVPGTAANASLFTDLNVGGRASDTKVVPGTGLSALVTVFERGVAEPTKGAGVIWQTVDGSLYSTSGAEVPSAEVSVAGETARVYRSEEIGELGLWGRGTLGGTSYAIKDSTPSSLIDGGFGHCPEVPAGECVWTKLVALPAGSTDVQLTLNPAATSSGWTSVTLSDGSVMVVAVMHSGDKQSQVVMSADYVDASGKAVHLSK